MSACIADCSNGVANCADAASLVSVLVVDDSLFMRTLVSDLLAFDPGLTVIGTASSGEEAIRKVRELKPNCVVLDLIMPDQHGLVTLKIIMAVCPTPVIVLSAHCQEGAELAQRCVAAGAAGFIPKPSGEVSLNIDVVGARLVAEVKKAAKRSTEFKTGVTGLHQAKQRNTSTQNLIVIGASTGGQSSIESILRLLPGGLTLPILVVQHAPSEVLTQSLAERWNRRCASPIKVARDKEPLSPGVVYVAPGGASLIIEHPLYATTEHPTFATTPSTRTCFSMRVDPRMSLTPSINLAMRSAAKTYGSTITAIILSGLGEDGVEGMRAVKAGGGRTIVQDRSASVFQLPKAVIDAGLADDVLSADAIAGRIVEAAL